MTTNEDIDGVPVEFETTDNLEVTAAEIKSLRTLYLSRIDDLDTSHYKLVSHIYSAPIANSKDGLLLDSGSSFSVAFNPAMAREIKQVQDPRNVKRNTGICPMTRRQG